MWGGHHGGEGGVDLACMLRYGTLHKGDVPLQHAVGSLRSSSDPFTHTHCDPRRTMARAGDGCGWTRKALPLEDQVV